MKRLVQTLGAALAAFLALAMAQEWSLFASAWFGDPGGREELPTAERQAATDTVHLLLSLMRHLYLSGGDPRFAERLPAADGLVEEMLEDVAYLGRNHRVEDPELRSFEVLSVEELEEGRLEVETRELWTFRVLWAVSGEEAEPARVRVVYGRYLLERRGAGWQVEGWDFAEAAGGAEAGPEAAGPPGIGGRRG